MNNNFLYDNNLTDYGIIICCGLILGCSIYYLIRSNNIVIPSENIETLTNEAIVNENAVTIINNENIDAIIDSDSDTDVESDYQSTSDNESTSDDESILGDDITDLDLFFMPNVDFDVCSIQELKFFEISCWFSRDIAEKMVTDEELMQLICLFTESDLASNWINNIILLVISNM